MDNVYKTVHKIIIANNQNAKNATYSANNVLAHHNRTVIHANKAISLMQINVINNVLIVIIIVLMDYGLIIRIKNAKNVLKVVRDVPINRFAFNVNKIKYL